MEATEEPPGEPTDSDRREFRRFCLGLFVLSVLVVWLNHWNAVNIGTFWPAVPLVMIPGGLMALGGLILGPRVMFALVMKGSRTWEQAAAASLLVAGLIAGGIAVLYYDGNLAWYLQALGM